MDTVWERVEHKGLLEVPAELDLGVDELDLQT